MMSTLHNIEDKAVFHHLVTTAFCTQANCAVEVLLPKKSDQDEKIAELSAKTVANLKSVCGEHGLRATGAKQELIERIMQTSFPDEQEKSLQEVFERFRDKTQ
eukprot:c19696_g1_i1.p2 GENE.c19696_g1_i1~~c19696_g1_i1.p2  ORF type:complete len:103 (-),score=22.10 c19696_g1_i1:114-422(-)